jgi:ketosteroid isomerase-like protein
MTTIRNFALAVVAALVFTAASSGPTKVAILGLEKNAYEAWKSKDAKFWSTFLSDKFVGWGSLGRLDKASATKEYTGADCEIKSYALSDEQVSPLGKDAVLITHKATVDGTCGGQKIPAKRWAASVYVRDGGKWKGAFHAQAAIVDPKAAPAAPVDTQEAPNEGDTQPKHRDARTDAMLAVERAVWEARRVHDSKKIADLTAKDISFINIFGVHLATKADALKDWSGDYCDVKSVSITDAAGTMLSPTVGILTHKATADGTCYGQRVGPVWGTSVYVKHGDVWKWTFGINLPARQ